MSKLADGYQLVPTGIDQRHFAVAATRPGGVGHIRDLATLEDPDAPPLRSMRFILGDEGACRDETGGPKASFRFQPGLWLWTCPLPLLTLVDAEELPIGAVTKLQIHPAGKIPGTVGACIVGEAQFSQTILASVYWQAMKRRIFNGVCLIASTADHKADLIRSGTIEGVKLETLRSACCPRARIFQSWVGPAPHPERGG